VSPLRDTVLNSINTDFFLIAYDFLSLSQHTHTREREREREREHERSSKQLAGRWWCTSLILEFKDSLVCKSRIARATQSVLGRRK
jgi:hypothetical protein